MKIIFVLLAALLFEINSGRYKLNQNNHYEAESEISNTWSGRVEKREWYKFASLENTFRLNSKFNDESKIVIIVGKSNDLDNLTIGVRANRPHIREWLNNQPNTTLGFILNYRQYKEIKSNSDDRGFCFRYSNSKDGQKTLYLMHYDNNFQTYSRQATLPNRDIPKGVVNTGGRIPPRQ